MTLTNQRECSFVFGHRATRCIPKADTRTNRETGSRLTVKFMATRGSAECLTNKHINENSWWNLTCRLAFHNKDTQKERKKDWMGERQKDKEGKRKGNIKMWKKEVDQSAVRWHRKHQQISLTIVMVTLHFTAKLQHTLTHTTAHRHLEFKCKCSDEAALSGCT